MKVIQQLIAYFEERGRLSPRQVEEFIKKGYWNLLTSSDLRSLEGQVGQSFYFETTGELRGPVWGTDTYTSDSDLGTVCVHAGLLGVGEKGVVRVTMVPPLAVFSGSTRHGVNSRNWTTGWPGAYEVALVRK